MTPLRTLALATIVLSPLAFASDHREAPLVQADIPADIADLYAFASPNDPNMTVLVLTVNGFTVPNENTTYNFSPDVLYSIRIDNTGNLDDDVDINFTFSNDFQNQTFTAEFAGQGTVTGPVTMPTLATSPNAPIVTTGPLGSKIFCGQSDDPFFFDVVGFNRVLGGGAFTQTDGFAGFNCSSIVVEIPTSYLTGGNTGALNIWGETARRFVQLRFNIEGFIAPAIRQWKQVDRVGNPAVNTALIPAARKDFYNVTDPFTDANLFANDIVASLTALGTSQANINVLASVAVPDTLKFDPSMPTAYPNGRALDDDVVDTLFSFIFNQTGVTDGVPANDKPFSNVFPYVAAPAQP